MQAARTWSAVALLACAVLTWGAMALPAQAQTYRCTTASGQRYTSSTPCPRPGSPQGMVRYGPAPEAYRRPTPPVPIPQATEELTYMSPQCASMKEGIRTAPARGVNSRTQAELRRNYAAQCSEDQAEAQRQLSEEKQLKRRELLDEKRQSQQQKQLARAEHDKLMSQCAEMRGAIRQRRARSGMTEGELRDLALFEERYQARCEAAAR